MPYFDHYKDLKNLEINLNELPLPHHSHTGYGGRQIAFGLILCNLFKKVKYDQLADLYYQYIMNDKISEDFRKKMEHILTTTVTYLNSVDIDKIILH